MIRIQLDLIADAKDNHMVASLVSSALDDLAARLGDLSILKWSVAPLPTVSEPTIEAATQEVSDA